MTKEAFFLLIDRHLDGDTSDKEKQQLINFTASFQNKEWNYEALGDPLALKTKLYERVRHSVNIPPVSPIADLKSAVDSLSYPYSAAPELSSPAVHRVHFLKTAWFRYAAVVLLIAGVITYLNLNNRPQQDITRKQPTTTNIPDIQPGGNKAILTLSDGSTIVLDSAANGALAQEGSMKILKLDAGSLAYQSGASASAVGNNTITAPRGGQYHVVLPDGTKVWLNAASSITFPTAFNGNRTIEMTGEVYFEVAKNAKQPFIVKIKNRMDIYVLGTSFNVNAYQNDASINATLIEGSLRVRQIARRAQSGDKNIILKPGQQATLENTLTSQKGQTGIVVLNNADIGKVMAWKNGAFNFENVSLEEAMKQLERWYDVEVVYEKGVPDIHFVGKMSRDISLAGLIRILEDAEVHFRIEGRKLIVMP